MTTNDLEKIEAEWAGGTPSPRRVGCSANSEEPNSAVFWIRELDSALEAMDYLEPEEIEDAGEADRRNFEAAPETIASLIAEVRRLRAAIGGSARNALTETEGDDAN